MFQQYGKIPPLTFWCFIGFITKLWITEWSFFCCWHRSKWPSSSELKGRWNQIKDCILPSLPWHLHCIFRPDTAWLSQQYTELITLSKVVSFPITPLLLVPSNPDKHPLCSVSLLQVTGCVNITWLIGHDKSCTLAIFFLVYSGPVSSRKLCLHPDLSAGSELASLSVPADLNHQGQRCALVRRHHGNGDCGRQRVCCLLWLEIKARVEVGMHGVEWEVMWLDVGW